MAHQEDAIKIVAEAREVYENHKGDGAWIVMEQYYVQAIAAALAARQDGGEADKMRKTIKDTIDRLWECDGSIRFTPATVRALFDIALRSGGAPIEQVSRDEQ